MTEPRTRPSEAELQAEITEALIAVWTRYAGKRPTAARTEIHGNVVTCVLVDAVGDYDANRITSQTPDGAGAGKFTSGAYKRDLLAAITRLTRRRVTSFISSHDPDTDVATEVFKLEQRAFA